MIDVLRQDIHRGNFRKAVHRDYSDLQEFYLDEDRKARLRRMHWFRRWLFATAWLLKSLFLKLSPARRLMLVIAVLLLLFPHTVQYNNEHTHINLNTNIASGVILLFVLMLELKDKLIARSELEAGRAVQSALMPEKSPAVPGYQIWLFTRTANEVGGDLVDFQRIDTSRSRIALGDVSGKGLSAALFTTKLQATLRALSPDFDLLAVVAEKVNRIFYRDSTRNTFVSLVYMELSANSNLIRLVNAGHLPPIILRGTSLEELPKGNPGIGIFPDTTYNEHLVPLQVGDILVAFSDGIQDAKNESGEFFGSARLHQLLPPIHSLNADAIGEGIVDEVQRFMGSARAYDDLSIAVVKYVGAASSAPIS